MNLSNARFIDILFERDAPVWYRWDGDQRGLTSALGDFLCQQVRGAHASQEPIRRFRQIDLPLWLLDRLLPSEDRDIFVPFLGESTLGKLGLRPDSCGAASLHPWRRAVYAWGRRLPADQRHQIFAVPFEPVGLGLLSGPYQAAMTAWAETCPAGEVASLFDWPDLCDQYQESVEHWTAQPLMSEYILRTPDVEDRLNTMVTVAYRLADQIERSSKVTWAIRSGLLAHLFNQIIKDTALSFPPPGEVMPQDDQAWKDWFEVELRAAGHLPVADLYVRITQKRPLYRLPIDFWIERHDGTTWQRLLEEAYVLEELRPYSVVRRLGQIIPPDRLDVWEPFVRMQGRGNYPIVVFCQWLRPEFRDVLLWYTARSETYDDVAGCAYQAYLHKTPLPVLLHSWGRQRLLPLWQILLLDRYMFAPEPIKPPPVVWDVQEVEADLRLEDPLNDRAF